MVVFLRQEILKKHFEKNFLLDHNEFRLKEKRFEINLNKKKTDRFTWFSFWWWSCNTLNRFFNILNMKSICIDLKNLIKIKTKILI